MVNAARRHNRVVRWAFTAGRPRFERGSRPGARRRGGHGHGGAGVSRAERVAARHRRAPTSAAARLRLGRLAGPRADARLQQEPHVLPLPLVPRLLGRQVTNFGVHYMDAIHWALGHDAPLAVAAMGGKVVIEDNREIPDTLEVLWTYPGGTLVTFCSTTRRPRPPRRTAASRSSSAAPRARSIFTATGTRSCPT